MKAAPSRCSWGGLADGETNVQGKDTNTIADAPFCFIHTAVRQRMPRLIAYFDTNVFGHLLDGNDSAREVRNQTRKAVKRGTLSIAFSILNVEETLAAPTTIALPRLRFMLDVADTRRLLKFPPGELLVDDLKCFRLSEPPTRPYFSRKDSQIVLTNVRDLLSGADQSAAMWLPSALEDVRTQKRQFRAALQKSRSALLAAAEQVRPQHGKGVRFEAFREACASWLIKDLAKRAAVPVDFDAGHLLKSVRSIRMYVGCLSSLLYEQGFCGRSPKDSDSRDMLHALSAAAVADVMVTNDRPLREVLARVCPKVFEVVDLRTFSKRALR